MSDLPPLNFNLVDAPSGRLALSICPGRREEGQPARRLDADLDELVSAGATVVVSLVETDEFELLGLSTDAMANACAARSLEWVHLPIRDMGVPDSSFFRLWQDAGPGLHAQLDSGNTVVLHCRGGLGRSGTVAAQLLIERGMAPVAAKAIVRAARPGAIETCQQATYLLTLV